MYYPINRANCRATLARKIKSVALDINLLKNVQHALSDYKRKQVNKYLIDELKTHNINMWPMTYGIGYQISDFDRILETSAPDRNGVSVATYRDNVHLFVDKPTEHDAPGVTEVDKFKLAVSGKLGGLKKYHAELLALDAILDAKLDEYETSAKAIEAITDIPGMGCLSDYVKSVR